MKSRCRIQKTTWLFIWLNSNHFNRSQIYGERRNFLETMYINSTTTNTAKAELKFDEAVIYEMRLVEQIRKIELETETKRAELKTKGASKEIFAEINSRLESMTNLKSKLLYERELKRQTWKQYANKVTSEDFTRLWNESLRDKTIIADVEGSARRNRR